MQRRRLLAAVGSAVGLGGCVGRGETPAGSTATPPLAERGDPADICGRPIVDLGIAAITDPAFGDGDLADEQVVIGVERAGAARAYPLSVLSRAEVVNDVLPDGTPILVTYCPVCDSGMVAKRRVDGAPAIFGVSGQVWEPPGADLRASERAGRTFGTNETVPERDGVRRDGALVLYDAATGSYWSQVLARAVCGPQRGSSLRVLPATTARWRDWRADHPDSAVLLPFPESDAGNPSVDGARTATPRPPE